MNKTILTFLVATVCLQAAAKDFVINAGQKVGIMFVPTSEPVAETALHMMQTDMSAVLSCDFFTTDDASQAQIITGIDSSHGIGSEGFHLWTEGGKLHVSGTDAHGLAYGLLEVSRLIGVSPWEWWADCTPLPLKQFRLKDGFSSSAAPQVRFRGIFINDEDWGIMPWATRQEPELAAEVLAGKYGKTSAKGIIGPKVNERIFQLLLRLRANYYWPAMHECTQPFFTIPGNREVAHRYGIYIGGSHCEPMACSTATEWPLRGVGKYNYVTNRDAVQQFWQTRLDAVKNQDIVYTIGMRGLHDGAMQGTRTMDDKVKYLQMAIDDQRQMLLNTVAPAKGQTGHIESVPQVFIPYKEVLDIYRNGLSVPDDVTLMWTDDNYGYIRQFPDAAERMRSGGNGVYYHASYWGRPHDYLWLSTTSPFLMRQQMETATEHGIQQVWLLNVGDIKPSEYIIEHWMDMAWLGTGSMPDERECIRRFMSREFGKKLGTQIADIMAEFYRLEYIHRAEFMGGTRTEESDRTYWALHHPIDGWTRSDADSRISAYSHLAKQVEALSLQVAADRRDAFFQLVKYPVQAAAMMNIKFLTTDRAESDRAYDSIVALTRTYNANPRWDGIMDMQPRKLTVFNRVAQPLTYPSAPVHASSRITLKPESGHQTFDGLGYNGDAVALKRGTTRMFTIRHSAQTDSICIELHLLPAHPTVDSRIAVSLKVQGGEAHDVEYQTYDRSEEWKQNVLRNQAIRTVTLPVKPGSRKTDVELTALTHGVVVDEIYWW